MTPPSAIITRCLASIARRRERGGAVAVASVGRADEPGEAVMGGLAIVEGPGAGGLSQPTVRLSDRSTAHVRVTDAADLAAGPWTPAA
jgi:hypothetical protein